MLSAVRVGLYAEANALLRAAEERGQLLAPTVEQQAGWLAELEATGAFQRDDWEHGQLVAELVERFQIQRLSGRWLPPVDRVDTEPVGADDVAEGRWGEMPHVSRKPVRHRAALASAIREGRATPLQRTPLADRRPTLRRTPPAAARAVAAPSTSIW